MTPALDQFVIDRQSESYWRVTFNNPPINLINPESILELQRVVDLIEQSPELRVVVFLSSNREYFMARYDLSRAGETPVQPGRTGLPAWIDLTTRLASVPAISIASIRGRARGAGSEFALACDMRFASRETAMLGQPEVAAGVLPGGGAIERLPLLVGRARALEIIIGSDDFDAATAERYGWINRSLPDSELDQFVDALARRIASFEGPPIGEAKRLLNRRSLPENSDLLQTQEAFLAAIRQPSAAIRGAKARQLAKTVGADFELRLGHHLGTL